MDVPCPLQKSHFMKYMKIITAGIFILLTAAIIGYSQDFKTTEWPERLILHILTCFAVVLITMWVFEHVEKTSIDDYKERLTPAQLYAMYMLKLISEGKVSFSDEEDCIAMGEDYEPEFAEWLLKRGISSFIGTEPCSRPTEFKTMLRAIASGKFVPKDAE